ncbi:MAG: hypothetical protein GWO41_10145, partial [candidate division Zixibacteria bacterium]|nr:hypothetical protein [candidate division Zixibacteria bacterium]NIX55097.1 hypothetical protein [candidate division Zixibacteria bacterium]
APIPYKSNLTERLRADHQELLAIHGSVLEAAQRGDCKTLDNRIRDFETGLKAHLSEEFRDLYVFTEYLANRHKSEQDRTQLRDFKQEMQIIGGQVMGILNKYNKEPIKDQQIPGIIADFTQMGGILADRIRREEATLYPMYDDYGARYEKNSAAGMSASPIHYRADLTAKLKDEHQQLLAIHGAVLQAAEQHNYEQINKSLKEFEQGLKSHLAEEFRDLYIYLEFLAKDHGANDDRQRLRDFKQEMQVIGGQVMGILNKYSK